MKIAMVANPIHSIPPRKGAAVEWWMYQVCRGLDAHERHIVCIADGERPLTEDLDGISFHRIRIGRLYKRLFQKITRLDPYSYTDRAARILEAVRPDIVHVHNAPTLFVALRGKLRTPAGFVLHMHNAMEFPPLPEGTELLVVSDYLRDWYNVRHPRANVRVVTNGVDVDLFRTASAMQDASARFHGKIPAGKRVVLYVGRMSPEKGPLDLVLAFNRLREQRSDVFLVLVGEFREGSGTDNRARYGQAIKDACAKIANDCWIVGNVDPAEVHRYYRRGDLLVVPSEFEEPFCMVAIEGMAAGVPVLAARKGGMPEYLREGETGFFIDNTKDHDAFAQRMSALLDAPDRLRHVADRAAGYVSANHSWTEVRRQLLAAYPSMR